jgi:hypothetical protein
MRAAIAATTVLALLLLGGFASAATPTGPYTPKAGDTFSYTESYVLLNGAGNYLGYTEGTYTNGSVSVTAVASNGTDSASFQNTNHYENNQGSNYQYPASGTFTLSALTYRYVNGTDNQTGYTNPYVWFFMDNALPVGGQFVLLNTPMTVASTNTSFELSSGRYVSTISADGSGSFQRDDSYGQFTAAYTWSANFDPATGYIVGYVYTETDSNPAGDGFTIHDTLTVTSTSYPLTNAAAPNAPGSSGSFGSSFLVLIVVVIVIVVLVLVAIYLRSRGRPAPPPRHAAQGSVPYVPLGPPPPGLHLTPGDQPTVQQVVVRETVKVSCRYCGALIDSTVTNCPVCGAPRS